MTIWNGESRPKAVCFDIDGTLVDSGEMIRHGLSDAFAEFLGDRPTSEWIDSIIGLPLHHQMQLLGLETHPIPLEERVQRAMQHYANHQSLTKPFSEAISVMNDLMRAGVSCALVTSRNRQEFQWIASLFPELSVLNVVVTATDVTHPKPHAEPLLRASAELGVQPSEMLYVGDTVHDAACAQGARVAYIAVSYGSGRESDLANLPAVMRCSTPQELQTKLQTLFELNLCPN